MMLLMSTLQSVRITKVVSTQEKIVHHDSESELITRSRRCFVRLAVVPGSLDSGEVTLYSGT